MDLKGHTGMMMTFEKGATMSFLQGHKLNVKSSTECELVGVDDAVPQMMWGMQYFNVPTVNKVLDEKAPVIDVLGPFGTGAPAIRGKKDG